MRILAGQRGLRYCRKRHERQDRSLSIATAASGEGFLANIRRPDASVEWRIKVRRRSIFCDVINPRIRLLNIDGASRHIDCRRIPFTTPVSSGEKISVLVCRGWPGPVAPITGPINIRARVGGKLATRQHDALNVELRRHFKSKRLFRLRAFAVDGKLIHRHELGRIAGVHWSQWRRPRQIIQKLKQSANARKNRSIQLIEFLKDAGKYSAYICDRDGRARHFSLAAHVESGRLEWERLVSRALKINWLCALSVAIMESKYRPWLARVSARDAAGVQREKLDDRADCQLARYVGNRARNWLVRRHLGNRGYGRAK
jgi:hypothetical protein